MRTISCGLALAISVTVLSAQAPTAPAAKLFASAADVSAMIAHAKATRKPDQATTIMVPENTPHWFGEIDGALVLMSIHLPKR